VQENEKRLKKRRRLLVAIAVTIATFGYAIFGNSSHLGNYDSEPPAAGASVEATERTYATAIEALGALAVRGRAPKTGYSRAQFGNGWATVGSCDVRNLILQRDLTATSLQPENNCKVLSGTLSDPYTGKTIQFRYGKDTSQAIQIDHVVALSDAWQKGAQTISAEKRHQFANDALNLLAVDGPANIKKGDSDAATWLPSNKPYRCRYVARQISVKIKYRLWITAAERDAMRRVLHTCPDQQLPLVNR
jgi:hypothetical protein